MSPEVKRVAIERPTEDAQRALGEVVDFVHRSGTAILSGAGTLTATGVAGPPREVTDEVGLTDDARVDLTRDVRPQLERVLAYGIETGFIAAKQGWQTVPRPVVHWPTDDGDPVISYMVGGAPTGASGHLELGGTADRQGADGGATGSIELGGSPPAPER